MFQTTNQYFSKANMSIMVIETAPSSRLVVVDGRGLQLQGHASAQWKEQRVSVPKCFRCIMVLHDTMKTFYIMFFNVYQFISGNLEIIAQMLRYVQILRSLRK